MHKAITITLLFGFLFIAVFGFAAMGHDAGGHHHGCIAATARASPCTDSSDPLGFAAFHLDAFKSFSSTTVSGMSFVMLVVVILLLIFTSAPFQRIVVHSLVLLFRTLLLQSHSLRETLRRTHFLALLEHSPAFF